MRPFALTSVKVELVVMDETFVTFVQGQAGVLVVI